MAETRSHKNAKRKAAGQAGRTEVSLKRNRRLDAASSKRATEIERSGGMTSQRKAAPEAKGQWQAPKGATSPSR